MLLMARPRAFDEQEVLDRAMETFWSRGYEAVSVDDLLAATGLSRSSIYQAFGNKRGIFGAALEFYVTSRLGGMLSGLEAEGAGLDDVEAFFGVLDDVARNYPDRFALGCLMTNSMTELGHTDDAIRAAGTAYTTRLRAAFANALGATSTDPAVVEQRAEILATLALGAFVRARGEAGTTALRPLARAVIASW